MRKVEISMRNYIRRLDRIISYIHKYKKANIILREWGENMLPYLYLGRHPLGYVSYSCQEDPVCIYENGTPIIDTIDKIDRMIIGQKLCLVVEENGAVRTYHMMYSRENGMVYIPIEEYIAYINRGLNDGSIKLSDTVRLNKMSIILFSVHAKIGNTFKCIATLRTINGYKRPVSRKRAMKFIDNISEYIETNFNNLFNERRQQRCKIRLRESLMRFLRMGGLGK